MTLREKQSRFAKYIGMLILWAYEQGYEITFGDFTALPCIHCGHYWHSRNSYHKRRLAADLNLFRDGKYLVSTKDHRPLGEYWESLDPMCTWGGRFRDGNYYSYGEGKE